MGRCTPNEKINTWNRDKWAVSVKQSIS